jgi:hypothetical protein
MSTVVAEEVSAFLELIHEQAARVTVGMREPGLLQLICVHPDSNDAVPQRFTIGDVATMTQVAIDYANAGHNVYIECRTVRPDLRGKKRGSIADTAAVFALVRDNDSDKGRAGTLAFIASLVVESSPRNSHDWIFLPPGLPLEEAIGIGKGLKALAGGDDNTGTITQPYRVAGTPNYPNATKRARGRTTTPTRILKSGGLAWTREQLLAAFPPPPKQERGEIPTGHSGVVDEGVEEIVSEPPRDRLRSHRFYDACKAAHAAGMTPDDLEALMRKHPNGCASKYLEPSDRLRREIERAWSKLAKKRPAASPTYPDNATTSVDAARAEVGRLIGRFLDSEGDRTHALQTTTGIGKTRIAARAIAKQIKSGQLKTPIGFAVPTHRLGEELVEIFRKEGITAAQWRGRKAFVSGTSGETMCKDLPAVRLAEQMGAPIETACCKGKKPDGLMATCSFYTSCAYQAQKRHDAPDVWLFAHQMLFQAQAALSELSVLFIDESFIDAGQSKPDTGLTLDEIERVPLGRGYMTEIANDLTPYREKLARALRKNGLGGVSRALLVAEGLSADDCTAAIKLEWKRKETVEMWPGMSLKQRESCRGNVRHIRTMDRIWRVARELIEKFDGDVVSGRLYVAEAKTENGVVRMVKTRGVRPIVEQYQVPALIMDATLPAKSILQKWFPNVEVVGCIEAPMPHTRARQVLGAPVTKRKLVGDDKRKPAGRALQAIRRHVLKRWIATGRGETLVICQKGVEEALTGTLPSNVHLAHFNAIAGLDRYKDVRLLITIGRTLPRMFDVEDTASLLSGVELRTPRGDGAMAWFDRVERGIRLRDGSGVAVTCDQHPDALAEALRWQVCEAEVVQAIGRGRGVNRTAETPLDIGILADVVLPLTIDQVEEWAVPGLEVEMEAEGIWLESPTDMAKAWPAVWATAKAAKEWLARSMGPNVYREDSSIGEWARARYQLAGDGQHWKAARFDPAVLPDPRAWLEARLGPLAGFEVEAPAWADVKQAGAAPEASASTPAQPARARPRTIVIEMSVPRRPGDQRCRKILIECQTVDGEVIDIRSKTLSFPLAGIERARRRIESEMASAS